MPVSKDKIARNQQRLLLLVQARDKCIEHAKALAELGMVIYTLRKDFNKESIDIEGDVIGNPDIDELKKHSTPFEIIQNSHTPARAIMNVKDAISYLNAINLQYEISDKDFMSTHMKKLRFEDGTPEDISLIDINAIFKQFKKNNGVTSKYYSVCFYMVKPEHKNIDDAPCIMATSRPNSISDKFKEAVKQSKYEKTAAIHIAIRKFCGRSDGCGRGDGDGYIAYQVKNESGGMSIDYTSEIINQEPVWVNQDDDVIGAYLMSKV